ncbi:MAG: lactate utilization protein [Acidobacteria bacterium]|nr:lactate utilization protein [Acidobacteriota bacterium]
MAATQEMERVIKALKLNNYNPVLYVDKAKDAVPIILDMIPADASIEMAGAVSVSQLGIQDLLRKRGNKGMEFPRPGESSPARKDVLLVSTNAVTLDGKLVNTDGMGNRVTGMAYGVKKVILLIGANKIVRDVNEALDRVQNVIAPYHAKYIGLNTPCALTEACSDCDSPQRICNITTILLKKPPMTDFAIVLTGEDLGLGWDPAWPEDRIEKIKAAYRVEMEKFRAMLPPRKD